MGVIRPSGRPARSRRLFAGWLLGAALFAGGCRGRESGTRSDAPALAAGSASVCPEKPGGLVLPRGFCATVFAESLGHARHLAITPSGVVYVNTWSGEYYGNDQPPAGGFLVALRDTTGDGVADAKVRFGDSVPSGGTGGTGIALYRGALYAEANDKIVRYALRSGSLAPSDSPVTVVEGLPLTGDHPMHPFAIDSSGNLYVNLGSATNACQIKNRTLHSPGHQPCTELKTRGGIWRYDANRTKQKFSPAERYATGIRNADGIAVDSTGQGLYATQHGRDQLRENWPNLYTATQGAELPAEELLRVQRHRDYGWPQCYFDPDQGKLVLAPEYGGDGGKAVGPCADKQGPVVAFPAHWAPLDLAFYHGSPFPAAYRGGLFIAFHGSWNRAPFPQEGYNVGFVPLEGGTLADRFEVFADGFAGESKDPGRAAHRPAGLAVGPEGALYISDDVQGTIWRVAYGGSTTVASRDENGGTPPAATGADTAPPGPPEGINPEAGASPGGAGPLPPRPAVPPGASGITGAMIALGDSVYHGLVAGGKCAGCHGPDGKGTRLGPDLTDGAWLWTDGSLQGIERVIAAGVPAPKKHTIPMPPMGGENLASEQVRAVAAYVYALSQTGGK